MTLSLKEIELQLTEDILDPSLWISYISLCKRYNIVPQLLYATCCYIPTLLPPNVTEVFRSYLSTIPPDRLLTLLSKVYGGIWRISPHFSECTLLIGNANFNTLYFFHYLDIPDVLHIIIFKCPNLRHTLSLDPPLYNGKLRSICIYHCHPSVDT